MNTYTIELELTRKSELNSLPFYKTYTIEDSNKNSAISRVLYSANEDIYNIKIRSVKAKYN